MKIFLVCLAVTVLAVWSSGCNRDGVKVYHIEKDNAGAPPPTSAGTTPAGLPAPENNQWRLKYILPVGWQQKTPTEMRVASFAVTNSNGQIADVGIIPLPTGENDLALINMWREQLQLPALTNAIAPENISVAGSSAKLFEITSEQPLIDGKFRARILVAELTRAPMSWFFKMTGEDSFVAAQKESFLQFLKSVSFVENAPAQIAAAPAPANPNARSIWTIPSDWRQLPPSEFLLAEFSIAGTNGATAEVNIAELAGEGGGLLANVNRWRQKQLGLDAVDQDGLEKLVSMFDANGSRASLVDFSGTNSKTGKPARLVGAIVPQNGQTWFYKLMGDPQIVAQQKDAFLKFIQSANYSNAR